MILLFYLFIAIYLPLTASAQCFSEQPSQTYCDLNKECSLCTNVNCKTCKENLTSCDTCPENTYFYQNDCTSQQPIGTFCDDKKVCQACSVENCTDCKGDINTCSLCNQANTKKYNYQGQCLEIQPPNTQCNAQNVCLFVNCINLIQYCATCDSVSNNRCAACQPGYYLTDYSIIPKQECVLKDEIPKYFFCSSYFCSQCSTQCSSCEDNKDKCTACSNFAHYLFNNQCYETQPPSKFCNTVTKICEECSVNNCFDCSDDKDICKKCNQSVPQKYLFQNQCLDNKTINMSCDVNNICSELGCGSKCKNCDISNQTCQECNDGFLLVVYPDSKQCIEKSNVPKNTLCDSKYCNFCSTNCATCQGDISTCSSCKQNKFHFKNQCYDSQPLKTFCDTSNVCQQCSNSECLTCESNLSTCLSCDLSKYLFKDQCLLQQPSGTNCDQITKKCESCTAQYCENCQNQIKICLKCEQSTFKYLYNGSCNSTQPQDTICDSNNVCANKNEPCGQNCKSCDSINLICTECNDGTFLVNYSAPDKPRCLEQKYIPKNTLCKNKQCNFCVSDKCQTCNDDINICTSCKLFNIPLYLHKGQCLSEQPINTSCVSKQVQLEDECLKFVTQTECQNFSQQCVFDNTLKCSQPNFVQSFKDTYTCTECQMDINGCKFCDTDLKTCVQAENETYILQNTLVVKSKSNVLEIEKEYNILCQASNICRCKQGNYFLNKCYSEKPQQSICDDTTFVCQKCFQLNSQCTLQQPQNTYCDSDKKCQSCLSTNCDQCNSDLKCNDCQNKQYSLNGACYSTIPDNAYCDSTTKICKQCKNTSCNSCELDLATCKRCMNNAYFFENECFEIQPKSTYCKIENAINVCSKCHQNCLECKGSSDNECTSCYPSATLSDSQCKKSALDYPSSFSVEKVKQLEQQVQATSETTTVSSAVLSTSQNFVSQSSFGLLISGLTSQKLTYMVLVDTNIPSPVFAALKSTADQLPSHQMQSLNFLVQLIPQSPLSMNKFLNIKFESIKLNYSIFDTCGQGVSIFLICSFLFGTFYFAKEKFANKKINSLAETLYSKVFSGFIVQYFQLIVSMFSIGINAQILEFINEENTEKLAIKVILTIILTLIVIMILHQIYYYLNFQTVKQNNNTFSEITRDKILNETIFESKLRRNYMLILLFVESIIIPTIFIQFYFNSIVSSILAIIFQLAFFILTCILMPFHSKLTNGYFVIVTLIWLALYISYLILNIYSSKSNISEYSTILDNISWSFIVFIQMILLSSPIYMILQLISKLIDFITQKLAERRLKKDAELLVQVSSIKQIEMNNSIVIQQKSMSQNLIYTSNSRELQSPTSSAISQTRHKWIKKYN